MNMMSREFYRLISIILLPPVCSSSSYLDNFRPPIGSKIVNQFINNYIKSYKIITIYIEGNVDKLSSVNEKITLQLIETLKDNHTFYLLDNKLLLMNSTVKLRENKVNIFICDENYLINTHFQTMLDETVNINIIVSISKEAICNDTLVKDFYKDVNKNGMTIIIVQYCQHEKRGVFKKVFKLNQNIDGDEGVFQAVEVNQDLEENFMTLIRNEKVRFGKDNFKKVKAHSSNYLDFHDVFRQEIQKHFLETLKMSADERKYENTSSTLSELLIENKDIDAVVLKNHRTLKELQRHDLDYTIPVKISNCLDFFKVLRCPKKLVKQNQFIFFVFTLGLALSVKCLSRIIWALEVIVYSKISDSNNNSRWFELDLMSLYSIFMRQPVNQKYSSPMQMIFVGCVMISSLIGYIYFYSTILKTSEIKIRNTIVQSYYCIHATRFLDDVNTELLTNMEDAEMAYAFRKNDPRFEVVEKKIIRMFESGLVDKLVKDHCVEHHFNTMLKYSDTQMYKLALYDCKEAFFILCGGTLLAAVIFLYQIISTKF